MTLEPQYDLPVEPFPLLYIDTGWNFATCSVDQLYSAGTAQARWQRVTGLQPTACASPYDGDSGQQYPGYCHRATFARPAGGNCVAGCPRNSGAAAGVGRRRDGVRNGKVGLVFRVTPKLSLTSRPSRRARPAL